MNDLVLLDQMNNPLILHNLRGRFKRDDIYTNVGTILISINPYKKLPIYSAEMLAKYQNKGTTELPPHVFNIASDTLKAVLDPQGGVNQSIVIRCVVFYLPNLVMCFQFSTDGCLLC